MTHRALIVGAGNAGKAHAAALTDIGIDFVGPLSGIASAADPTWLSDPSIDVIHVATANDLHVPLVSQALRASKHVVCEKPLAGDIAGAEQLAELVDMSGTRATLCHNYRFLPMIVELRSRVSTGELGEVHLARGSFLQDWLLMATDENWRLNASRGGLSRAVADIGVHWLDLIEVITGRKVEEVVAQLGYLHERKTEDHAGLLLKFSGGLQGICVLSQASAGHIDELELSLDGTAGSATWRGERRNELWLGARNREPEIVERRGDLRSVEAGALAARPDQPGEGRRNLLAAFYASLDGVRSPVPLPTFDDGLRHVRFAAAAVTSARTRAWIEVKAMHATAPAASL